MFKYHEIQYPSAITFEQTLAFFSADNLRIACSNGKNVSCISFIFMVMSDQTQAQRTYVMSIEWDLLCVTICTLLNQSIFAWHLSAEATFQNDSSQLNIKIIHTQTQKSYCRLADGFRDQRQYKCCRTMTTLLLVKRTLFIFLLRSSALRSIHTTIGPLPSAHTAHKKTNIRIYIHRMRPKFVAAEVPEFEMAANEAEQWKRQKKDEEGVSDEWMGNKNENARK